ncbi:MAG TPA: hypothetical protein VKS60_14010 [Stellaceae bacterium]|nr:hypothetical protein [Stellaceae bacterium]
MTTKRHAWGVAAVAAASVPMGGLAYWSSLGDTRTAADLEVADRCIAEAHDPQGTTPANEPDLAARCDRYFRLRSEAEADADEQRWRDRQKLNTEPDAHGTR